MCHRTITPMAHSLFKLKSKISYRHPTNGSQYFQQHSAKMWPSSFSSNSISDTLLHHTQATFTLLHYRIKGIIAVWFKHNCTGKLRSFHRRYWWLLVLSLQSHQRGGGPPVGCRSVFRASQMLTPVWVREQYQFAEAPFRGTGSALHIPAGSAEESLREWSLRAPTLVPPCGDAADLRQCKQHNTISTNRSTAEPAGGIRAGMSE